MIKTVWPNVDVRKTEYTQDSSPALLSLLPLAMTATRTHDLPAIHHL